MSYSINKTSNQNEIVGNSYKSNIIKPNFVTSNALELSRYNSSNLLELHKSIFLKVLRRVTAEYGPIVIIIDALDEIGGTKQNLSFLPQKLPENVSVLLTVRPNLGIEKWLMNYCRMSIFPDEIGGILREDIPKFTGVDDYAGILEKKFNNEVYEKSKGWSLQLAAISRKLKEVNGNFKVVDVDDELNKYFERQKDEWLNDYKNSLSGDYLNELLNFLSVFEPISAISLDDVQGYMETKYNTRFKLDQIKELLEPVAYQIQGLETTKKNIKLGIKAFAEYVKKGLGKRDLKRYLEDYSEWMKNDEDIEIKLIAEFLNYWFDKGSRKEIEIVESVIDYYIEEGNFVTVKNIAKLLIKTYGKPTEAYIYCLKALKEEDEESLFKYVYYVLKDNKNNSSKKIEAKNWLFELAEKNHISAMRFIGISQIEGKHLEVDILSGQNWLDKAIDLDDIKSMNILGNLLIIGEKLEQNLDKGINLLEKAIDKNDEKSMIDLAMHYLLGTYVQQNSIKSKDLLLKCALEKKSSIAMHILGNHLLEVDNLSQNIEEGEYWLKEAANASNYNAALELGMRKIIGDKLEKDIPEGEEWIKSACDAGHEPSMLELADLYLKGKYINIDINEGEKILIEAAKQKSVKAMNLLGRYYLDGMYDFRQNPEEAVKWLRYAIDQDSNNARLTLGIALIEGKDLPKNEKQGINYLKECISNEYVPAFNALGCMYLEGVYTKKNKIEGEKLLRKGIELGDNLAKRNLVNFILDGKEDTPKSSECRKLILELIEEQNIGAVELYCKLALVENIFNDSIYEVREILEKEVAKGNTFAMSVLADYLIEGKFLEGNLEEGIRLLELACEKNCNEAMSNYGEKLLSGKEIPRNIDKGIVLLEKAVEKGESWACHVLGYYYYNEVKDFKKSFEYFYRNYREGRYESINELVYLMRRNEIPDGVHLDSDRIINMISESRDSMSIVNYALYLIKFKDNGWGESERLFSQMEKDDIKSVEEWWYDLAKSGDCEGDLVIGLLVRHKFIEDPDGLSIEERLYKAKANWDYPKWIAKAR